MWKSKASTNNKQIVQRLLESGADATIKNKQNKTAIDMSDKLEQELLQMIEEANPPPVAPILKINTPQER